MTQHAKARPRAAGDRDCTGVAIAAYPEDRVEAVRRFNARLRKAGIDFQLPERSTSGRMPPGRGRDVSAEFFLAVEGDEVRGGYVLKRQTFRIAGVERSVGILRMALSEGVIDRRFGLLGVRIVKDALKRSPLLYGLGMGGEHEPLPRLLAAMRFGMSRVPMYFKALRPDRLLCELPALRSTPGRRLASGALARSGIGSAGIRSLQALQAAAAGGRPEGGRVVAEVAPSFGPWADEIWQAERDAYGAVGARDAATLDLLYPPGAPRPGRGPEDSAFERLVLRRKGALVGWAVVLCTPMRGSKHFGDLRVGTVVDAFARPDDAAVVVREAAAFLAERGADVIVSNQAHDAWGRALRRAGFLPGPSNFVLATSPELSRMLAPRSEALRTLHLNRGDGDGPVNL